MIAFYVLPAEETTFKRIFQMISFSEIIVLFDNVYNARIKAVYTNLAVNKSVIRYELSNQLLRCWADGGFTNM